jgi:hypothetical protein
MMASSAVVGAVGNISRSNQQALVASLDQIIHLAQVHILQHATHCGVSRGFADGAGRWVVNAPGTTRRMVAVPPNFAISLLATFRSG